MAINQIIRGAITLSNVQGSAAVTIPSVVTAKSNLDNIGSMSQSIATFQCALDLTGPTTITGSHQSGAGTTTTQYQVVERT